MNSWGGGGSFKGSHIMVLILPNSPGMRKAVLWINTRAFQACRESLVSERKSPVYMSSRETRPWAGSWDIMICFLNRQLSQCEGSSFAAAIKEYSSYKTETFASAWLAIGQETVEKFIYALSKEELFIWALLSYNTYKLEEEGLQNFLLSILVLNWQKLISPKKR